MLFSNMNARLYRQPGLWKSEVGLQGDVAAPKQQKGGAATQRHNIVTSPCKRGGYGYNLTTLGERQGAQGVANFSHLFYIRNPIDKIVLLDCFGASPQAYCSIALLVNYLLLLITSSRKCSCNS